MENFRRHSWLKTLDDHREPSLYYLSTSDDKSGPHLICDWNGAPANFEEFEIDRMSLSLSEQTTWEKAPVPTRPRHHHGPPPKHAARLLDSFRPHRPIEELNEDAGSDISPIHVPKYSCSHSVISEDDGSYFNLLTVPPMPAGLFNKLKLAAKSKSTNSTTTTTTTTTNTNTTTTATTTATSKHQQDESCSSFKISPSKRANLVAKDYKTDPMKKVGRSKKEKQ